MRAFPGTAARITLAVVEDDLDVRTALGRLLRSMGHEVHLFESTESFEIAPSSVDCIILDVRLPGLSGLEFGEQLRRNGVRVPLVFITGDGDLPAGEELAHRNDPPLLTKPFSDDELLEAVARACGMDPAEFPDRGVRP